MAIPQQTKPAQQTVTEEQRTEFQKLLEKDLKLMEYIPFQGDQPIKLTPKIVLEYLAIPTKSGKWPTERDCLRFMMLCRARKLNPFEGDAWLLGYDTGDGPKFELITAHAALMKRAEAKDNYDGMESGIVYTPSDPCKLCDSKGFVPKGDDLRECPRCHGSGTCDEIKGSLVPADKKLAGGWAVIRFKQKSTPQYDRVQLSAYQKGFGRWKDDAAGQIQKCYDSETEVLTTRGFEKFAIAKGDVLQVTPHGLVPVKAIPFSQTWRGTMIAFKNHCLEFCVTPNHTMITSSGSVDAGALLECTINNHVRIPRIVPNTKTEAAINDTSIQLAAAFLCDGYGQYNTFRIAVSKPRKVRLLEELGRHRARSVVHSNGAALSGRVITTQSNKDLFVYRLEELGGLTTVKKQPDVAILLSLSMRQAKLFVDTLIAFGHTARTSRRFYSSRPEIAMAFEIAAVSAGYSVRRMRERRSDISSKPNWGFTISEKNEVPVYKSRNKERPILGVEINYSGKVWCVTVPSGKIVVRRKGFSFVCGNCAEASVARLAFPNTLGALYLREELETSPEKITGNAPPVFDMPATEPPKSSGTNGMKPTAGGEDEVPFDSLPKKKPSEGKTTEEVLAFLKMCMHESGVSEDQIIGHCKIVGMASAKIEELPQLADSKLRTLADEWDTRLPDIQGVVI